MSVVILYFLLLRATALSFSGFASVPVVREEFVAHRGVLTDEQLNSAIAISQASPGPLGLYVVVLGYFVAGTPGALAGALALATPAILAIPIARAVRRHRDSQVSRRLRRDRDRILRPDGDHKRAACTRGGSKPSIRATRRDGVHRADFGPRAARYRDSGVGLSRTASRVIKTEVEAGAVRSLTYGESADHVYADARRLERSP